jgi:GTPase SAR1 family protein
MLKIIKRRINVEKKEMQIKDTNVNFCIWDTAGQEKFFALTKCIYII